MFPPTIQRLLRLAAGLLCCLAVIASSGSLSAPATTASTAVGATVVSTSSIDVTGCRSGVSGSTTLGTVTSGSGVIGSGDCAVTFGSSNDTARLVAAQGDGLGTAMASMSTTQTRVHDDTRLHAIDAFAANAAWAAGQGGAISAWDGTSWTSQPSGTVNTLYGVGAASALRAWVVGNGLNIRRTINGGASWTSQFSGTGILRDVDPFSTSVAWAVGDAGAILYTGDGGTTWSPQSSGTTSVLRGVVALSATSAVIVGDGGLILRTTDTGATWNVVASGSVANLRAVSASSAGDLVAAGDYGTVLISSDAGASFTPPATAPNGSSYYAVITPSPSTIVAITTGGRISRTANGGATWSYDTTLWQNDGRGGAAAGGTYFIAGFGSLKATSTDGGATWAADATFRPSFNGAFADTHDSAWVVGTRGRIEHTSDGASMVTQPSGTVEQLWDVDGVGGTLWVVGEGGTMLTSTNDGSSWTARPTGTANTLRSVSAVSEQVAWVAGGTSRVWRTLDGGASWTLQTLPGTSTMYTVDAANREVAWASGNNAYVARTLDGGTTWTSIGLPAVFAGEKAYVSGAEPSGQRAVVAGSNGRVFATADGGATWTPVTGADGVSTTANALEAHDTGSMAIGISSAAVLYTADGTTWVTAPAGNPTRSLEGISYASPHAIWTANDSFMVARIDVGAASIPDYVDDPGNASGSDWGTPGAAFFGACLRTLTGGSPAAWAVDANSDCTASDSDPWHDFPASRGAAGAIIARSTTVGTDATASLRFAMRAGPTTPATSYAAGIRFEVVAPGT